MTLTPAQILGDVTLFGLRSRVDSVCCVSIKRIVYTSAASRIFMTTHCYLYRKSRRLNGRRVRRSRVATTLQAQARGAHTSTAASTRFVSAPSSNRCSRKRSQPQTSLTGAYTCRSSAAGSARDTCQERAGGDQGEPVAKKRKRTGPSQHAKGLAQHALARQSCS